MENNYFDRGYRGSIKVRWIAKFLKYSGFMELAGLRLLIDEKLCRIEKRKGSLNDQAICKIIENLLMAKIAKKYLDKRIKPYKPRVSKDSPTVSYRREAFVNLPYSYRLSSAAIFKERHYRMRRNPSILLPGFLPDGNEAFFLLRKCFRKFGAVYYFNYPTRHFHKETIFYQLFDTIVQINKRKFKAPGPKPAPFLIGTSFGGHMIVSFIKWLRERGLTERVHIRGLILISPVLCLEDIVDPHLQRQKTLVGRSVSHLLETDPGNPEAVSKNMQKAKSIMVKMFTSGRDLMNFESKDLIPIFAIEDDVLNVFRQSEEDDVGYFTRFIELRKEPPIQQRFLTGIPTLVLFAEGEGDVMTANSPTFHAFSQANPLRQIFPEGTVEFVHSNSSVRKVTHSDLIFQADRFIEHLEPWLDKVAK